MPDARTAQYLCDRARDMVGIYDRSLLRDGFAADAGEADRAILPAINQALAVFAQSGFTQTDFSTATTSGTYEYPLSVSTDMIVDVYYTDNGGQKKPLKATEFVDLNNRVPGWRNVTPRTPNVFITNGQTLTLYPAPNGTGPLVVRAYQTPPDLATGTDVPAYLPDLFHDALAILGAWLMIAGGVIADPAVSSAREAGVASAWQMQSDALTRVIVARTVVANATRVEGGDS